MNYISSLLIFIALISCVISVSLSRRNYTIKHPNNRRLSFTIGPREYLIIFLLSACIIQCDSFSAFLLMSWILGLSIVFIKSPRLRLNIPVNFWYMMYLLWLVISLIYAENLIFGIRVFLKYLFPFLILLVAERVYLTELYFLKVIRTCVLSGFILNSLIFTANFIPIESLYRIIFWWPPAVIDAAPFFFVCGIIYYKYIRKKYLLIYLILILLNPILDGVRTGLVGIAVFLLFAALFRYRFRAIVPAGLVVASLVAIIIYVPSVREKMFYSSFDSAQGLIEAKNDISLDNINTNGRSALWTWALNEFYFSKELLGSGLGSVQARLYQGDLFNGLTVVHNDYVQILCDTGQVGLFLYLMVVISFVYSSYRMYRNVNRDEIIRTAAFVAGTSLPGIMACAFTDNVVNYSLLTLSYPYVLFGLSRGLLIREQYEN